MLNGVEKAKTNRSKCWTCRKPIYLGTPRGYEPSLRYPNVNNLYCMKCSIEKLKIETEHLKHLKKEMNKLIKSCSKELILEKMEMEKNETKSKE